MSARLAVFVTHPVQYHVPIWRQLASTPGLEVEVFYFSDHSVRGGVDHGFGQNVTWDVPMLEGYTSTFVTRDADLSRPADVSLPNAEAILVEGGFTHVLLHGYTHGFERQVLQAARQLGLRTILRGEFADSGQRRSLIKRKARDLYLRRFYRKADALCYIGEEARRHLSRFVDEDRLHFAPYSVDSDLFEAQKGRYSREASRAALGIPDDEFVFLFTGKLIPRKCPMLLLEAMARMPDSCNASVLMVGDGPLRDAVIDRGTLVLGKKFRFRGFVNQSQLGSCYRAADAFVLPSDYEAWGLVANEAMQFGLPVVVSENVNCHEDLVIPSRTGYVFRNGDANSLAATLTLLAADQNRATAMGKRAERHVERYSTAASVEGIVDALQSADVEGAHA